MIDVVSGDCEGKISTNKVRVAGASRARCKTHHLVGIILTSKGDHLFNL